MEQTAAVHAFASRGHRSNDRRSAVVDALSTIVTGGMQVKLSACRLGDIAVIVVGAL